MPDDELTPELPPEREPRFRIEANTWEELLDQLQAIAPESGDFSFRAAKEERVRSPEAVPPPDRETRREMGHLAEELTARLRETPVVPDIDETPDYDPSGWRPPRRSEPGAVRRRMYARRARQMESEAGYVWLYDAMLARDLTDREEAVRELERVGDAARLERLAEHSPQRVTRRAALDALARMKAVPALESVALYLRAEIYAPKKPKSEESESALSRIVPEFHDDTRDHAVDLLGQLADENILEAVTALKRVARYDFSPDGGARFRALRRLAERLDRLERERDWSGISMVYRETRSSKARREIGDLFSRHMDELIEAEEIDALLAVSDMRPDLRDRAEEAIRRLERP